VEIAMKHLIRDSIIFLIDILGVSAVYRFYVRKKGPLVRVIAFHDVASAEWFEEVIEMIAFNYCLITPQQFHTKEFDAQKINVLLTFDDGYQSWIDVCLPILTKYNAKAIFFVNSGLLDIADDGEKVSEYMQKRLLISHKKPLSWEGAKKLVGEGHTIGGHTVSHPRLSALDRTAIHDEVKNDKLRVETQLGIEVVDFGYPFGNTKDFSKSSIQKVKEVGYTWQYSAVSSFVLHEQDALIPRTLVENKQTVKNLKRWINGAYDVFKVII